MRYITIAILLITVLYACIDRYDFLVENKQPGIVIEGFISDKSYNDTRAYPSEGRYLRLKLSWSSDVVNVRNKPIQGAYVSLHYLGNRIEYQEDLDHPGEYFINNKDFKAKPGEEYQLRINALGYLILSEYVTLPSNGTTLLDNEVDIKETTLSKYEYLNDNEKEIRTFHGIDLSVRTPPNDTEKAKYYKWNFDPLWIYIAPKARKTSPYRTCWVTSDYYLSGYQLFKDNAGGIMQDIAFIQTQGNEKVYEYMSVLINQYEMNQSFYEFHIDLKENFNRGGLYDQLPYNLMTNFNVIGENSDVQVFGYFDAVNEDAVRWTFDPNKISYPIVNNLQELCSISYGPPAPGESDQCHDCTAYTDGEAVNYPPSWW